MALTVCAYCDECYIETFESCDKCGLTLEQQLFWMRQKRFPGDRWGWFFPTPYIFKVKMKIFFKWVLEVIFY